MDKSKIPVIVDPNFDEVKHGHIVALVTPFALAIAHGQVEQRFDTAARVRVYEYMEDYCDVSDRDDSFEFQLANSGPNGEEIKVTVEMVDNSTAEIVVDGGKLEVRAFLSCDGSYHIARIFRSDRSPHNLAAAAAKLGYKPALDSNLH
jgi:hypothetical protein